MANRLQKGRAAAAVAVALVGAFEGLRQNAYPDPATQGTALDDLLRQHQWREATRSHEGTLLNLSVKL